MASVHRFENYSSVQLAKELEFISWVKCPDAKSDLFWNGYLGLYPSQTDTVERARAIVLQMQLEKYEIGENRAAAVWEDISRRIKVLTSGDGHRSKISYSWLAAAAVVLFAVAGIWFIRQGRDMAKSAKEVVAKAPDIAPGGNRAVLTLADGRTLVLDTTANGAVTNQGNVTIIKLNNGQLAYDKQGSVSEVLYNTVTTPRGGQYQLVLAEGTRVWLNAASSLRFPTAFTGDERRVELTGEGYFEVAHDATKPFHVQVNDMDVQVLGTHFNINSYADEPSVKTTLLEGRVKVKDGINYVFLNPGQQAIVAGKNQSVRIRNGVDLDEVVAWKNGRFEFNNTTIETVMRQLSRWYDVDIEYVGSRPDIHFVGSIARTENISEVLHMLEQTKAVRFQINQRKIQVMK